MLVQFDPLSTSSDDAIAVCRCPPTEHLRQKMQSLVSRGYSSITVAQCGALMGLSQQDILSRKLSQFVRMLPPAAVCLSPNDETGRSHNGMKWPFLAGAVDLGWKIEGDMVHVKDTVPHKNQKASLEQLQQLTAYINQLEA